MLLTHVSSVLITFVTVAAFTHLEEPPPEATSSTNDDDDDNGRIQFTAARLFASLALFNQLTVPLFIFPITIPIILSAVVSTRRLQAFLAQPEVVGAGGGGDVDQKRRREGRRPRNKKGGTRADDVVGDDPWLAAAVDDELDDDDDNDGGEEGGILQNSSLKDGKLGDVGKCGEYL